jgi:hypothetical protein
MHVKRLDMHQCSKYNACVPCNARVNSTMRFLHLVPTHGMACSSKPSSPLR